MRAGRRDAVHAAALRARLAALARQQRGTSGLARLTAREHEILLLLAEGLADKEIAARLSIALRAVKNHVHRVLEKLDVRRRGEAVAVLRGSGSVPAKGPARY